jgi:hemerythrin-like domain-containing protein
MRRHADLVQLSREHHAALKLARAMRRAAESGSAEAVAMGAQRVVKLFPDELEPHFRDEEENLFAWLERAGEHALVERTMRDHAQLRQLAATLAMQPDVDALARFADLLAEHVRFEERELFESAQACMSAHVAPSA